MTTPDGWDEIDPDMLESAKQLRQAYVAMIATGFTTLEAATIIAAIMGTNNKINPSAPGGS